MSDDTTRPDPKTNPPAEWFMTILASLGDNSGADFNDADAVNGYFGWDAAAVLNSLGGFMRYEIEVYWEPEELLGKKNTRHVRRFHLIERGNGETIDV